MKQQTIWMLAFITMCLIGENVLGGQTQDRGQPKEAPRKESLEKEEQKQARQQQIERIMVVLRTTGAGAKDWKDPRAASRVQAQVADLLWDSDADTARRLLIYAWDTSGHVENPKQERSRFRNQSIKTDARREVILVARHRAPELAKKWLEQMAQDAESDQNKQERGAFDDRTARSTVLLQMALQTVAENPEAAAGMATDSLADGISFGFQEVLLRIQEKDFNLAQKVFRAAMARLQTAGMLDPNELLILYAYLYTPGRIMAANTGDDRSRTQIALGRNKSQIAAAAILNPALALEFLQLGANLLINSPLPVTTENPALTARSQLSAIGALLGQLSQRQPDLAAALQAHAQQIGADARFATTSSSSQPEMPKPLPGEDGTSYAERRVEMLEEAADKEHDKLRRDIAYAKAALATTIPGYSKGWDIAGKIDDDTLRDDLRNWLTYRATLYFIGANNLDRAYELASKNSNPAQRAASLVVGAQKLIKTKETDRATQWLEESRSLIRRGDPNENNLRIAFGVVSAYGRFDNPTAFAALSDAINLMGKVDLQAGDEDRAPPVKNFAGFEMPDFTYGTDGFSLKSAIAVFSPDLFDDVLAVINRIKQPETRGVATLDLCRGYLKSNVNQQIKSSANLPSKSPKNSP
jgi:hypothetical protein